MLKVLVGERVQFVLETDREGPLDFILPLLFLKSPILGQFALQLGVFFVELDADITRVTWDQIQGWLNLRAAATMGFAQSGVC